MYLNIILLLNIGLVAGKMEPFIVGGDYVDMKQFPHSAYIYVDCITASICGGSILTSNIVITAGHCSYECQNIDTNTIVIHFGHSLISKMKSLPVSQFLVHEKYNEEQLANDISLLYTNKSIPFGEVVKRVSIVGRFPTRATGGYVTGWGVINSKLETSLSMKYIYQELQNRKMCENLIDIPKGTFCARSKSKDQYPEQGDSGGAFVVYDFVQIGVVSFKHVNHDLIAYTNVTYYYKWIKNNAIKLSCGHFF